MEKKLLMGKKETLQTLNTHVFEKSISKHLIVDLSNPNDQVRWEAARSLRDIRESAAAPALVKLLEDENTGVRWAASDALIALDKAVILPLLLALRKDFGSVWLREGAHHIFHKLKDRGRLSPSLLRVFNALESIEPVMEVPWAVKNALEEMHVTIENEEKGKKIMDIPINAEVLCINDSAGTSTHIIVDPVKDQVTHLVVKEKYYPNEERLVAVEHVIESNPTLIRLDCTIDELTNMQAFVEREFIPTEYQSMSPSMLWPYAAPDYPFNFLEHERVPPDELSIRRGTEVIATDGRVGKVDEFLVEPESGYITHLVLREGHLWGQKDITIPITQIDKIEEDAVYLKVDKAFIESLPAIPINKRKAQPDGEQNNI
jgi:sporulation protein YlmC with PRC-barrel domain